MSTTAIAQILYQLDGAFEATEWHSLLRNLRSVKAEDWDWVPPDGRRSIRDIVLHVGGAKLLYENHAFGDATLAWDDPALENPALAATLEQAINWLRACQEQLRAGVAALDDDELLRPRPNFRGQLKETRWLITIMIQHDLYHAGEINHIRALHQGDDY